MYSSIKHGKGNPKVFFLHGGPGAMGEMHKVCSIISEHTTAIEHLQAQDSIEGQIQELYECIISETKTPIILVGYSWGAWLGYIFTSRYPELIKKLILISSGGFKDVHGQELTVTRLKRLNPKDKRRAVEIMELLDKNIENKQELILEFADLISKADSFDPIEDDDEVEFNYHIFEKVWKEASELRKSGKLLDYGKSIKCPVIAFHGDHDPHPMQGVLNPLSEVLIDFKFIIIKNCGHKPWIEKRAKNKFFEVLEREII